MASYVIVGASRGIGYKYLQILSANPDNIVIGLARNPVPVQEKLRGEGISNVHVLQGDLTDNASLVAAAKEVSQITGGSLDHLIVNGAYLSDSTQFISPSEFKGKEDLLVSELNSSMAANVVGAIYSINAFIDLSKKSEIKKIIIISSGAADLDLIAAGSWTGAVPYCISKAAVNLLAVKYAVEFKTDGIIFLALSPGLVATEQNNNLETNPTFKGPISMEESVTSMLEVIQKLTIKESGSFLSHHGDKNWL
ncbi:NAD(P)-binding protein [Aaosphaeria arxii CBS 175.79]|uniref:NAD(P)-binding protein n=1 Tax=Aaosphaeria arxii CBS 175.79 TaxID=1450172 RepID=A0A6A5XPV6_9PLEO|nr:NAD(P)-binding protein [Aaosphaeria arxii CBS 175.79]KAF2015182.1 NAD(P)-binding protein [Aaosphaeria arxii CBS 175.79]